MKSCLKRIGLLFKICTSPVLLQSLDYDSIEFWTTLNCHGLGQFEKTSLHSSPFPRLTSCCLWYPPLLRRNQSRALLVQILPFLAATIEQYSWWEIQFWYSAHKKLEHYFVVIVEWILWRRRIRKLTSKMFSYYAATGRYFGEIQLKFRPFPKITLPKQLQW